MIRALLGALALLSIASCTPQAGGGCDMVFMREIAFTRPDAADNIIVRAIGPSCDKAVGVYTIHDADGHPIWAWSAPLSRAFGDLVPHGDEAEMRAFLERWASGQQSSTQSAPEWSALTPGQTTLDQLTYEDIRARDLPMLCHYSGTARETCVFWEPAAGGAGHLLDRDIEEINP